MYRKTPTEKLSAYAASGLRTRAADLKFRESREAAARSRTITTRDAAAAILRVLPAGRVTHRLFLAQRQTVASPTRTFGI